MPEAGVRACCPVKCRQAEWIAFTGARCRKKLLISPAQRTAARCRWRQPQVTREVLESYILSGDYNGKELMKEAQDIALDILSDLDQNA